MSALSPSPHLCLSPSPHLSLPPSPPPPPSLPLPSLPPSPPSLSPSISPLSFSLPLSSLCPSLLPLPLLSLYHALVSDIQATVVRLINLMLMRSQQLLATLVKVSAPLTNQILGDYSTRYSHNSFLDVEVVVEACHIVPPSTKDL